MHSNEDYFVVDGIWPRANIPRESYQHFENLLAVRTNVNIFPDNCSLDYSRDVRRI